MTKTLIQKMAAAGAAVLLAAGSAGCKHTDEGVTQIPTAGDDVPGGNAGAAPPPPVFDPNAGNPTPPPLDPNPAMIPTDDTEMSSEPVNPDDFIVDRDYFAANVVYFGLDLSSIDGTEGPKIEEVADYLRTNPANHVRVEGHCDERGTEQYNLALGERRALSIRTYLIDLGVEGDRVHTISLGETAPVDSNTTEEAYAKNRRGEFLLLTPRQ